ncbi:MAG TPA: sulfotransferase [Rhizomicrobium sp.]|nr:sulfotransferase [Rhizomicrobium sp.]
MTRTTQPFFIVSSGRSGTAMLHKALSASGDTEMHHEYMVQIVQPLAVRRYLDLCDASQTIRALSEVYSAAIYYSPAANWGDSSNKLSWLIPELAALLPEAKFVHLVRDGRKVAGSYFHKLADECYDDHSTAVLQAFVDNRARNPAPPPEKKYWWPVPRKGDPRAADFRTYNQFERIAWHWMEINRTITHALGALPGWRHHFVRLEELRERPSALKGLSDFLNLSYRDEQYAMFARPHNVNRPRDTPLTGEQRAQFDAIAGAMMGELGYHAREAYAVNY